MGRCKRVDCRYHMRESVAAAEGPSCDYFGKTGRLRLGEIRRQYGIDRLTKETAPFFDAAACPCYKPDDGKKRKSKSICLPGSSPRRKTEFKTKAQTAGTLPEEERRRRLELYNQGLNDVEIGRAVGLSSNGVRSWRLREDLPANYRTGFQPKFDRAEARRLYEQRKTDKEISEALGAIRCTITTWRNREGLPAWSRKEREEWTSRAATT